MTAKDEDWFLMAPDMSVTFTRDQMMQALFAFEFINWDMFELQVPPGAEDIDGAPIDRNNRHVRLAFMAEATVKARGGEPGTGIELMDNPYFNIAVRTLLDMLDKARGRK